MAYDISKIQDYVSRESEVLTATLFSQNDTSKVARFITGIKTSTEILKLSGGAKLQAGYHKTPDGNTKGEMVTLAVKPFTYYEGLEQDYLQDVLPNQVLAPGSNNAQNGHKEWEEALIDTKVSSISEQLEDMYWKGDTSGTDYALFDGFLKQIDASTEVIKGNTSNATEITMDNVIDLVDAMRNAAPAKVKRNKDFSVYVSDEIFDLYIAKVKQENMFHQNPDDHNDGVYRIAGSGLKLVRMFGLNGTDRMVATVGENLVVGVDVEGEEKVLDIWYDKTADSTYLRCKMKGGTVLTNPQEIVEFTLSA